MAAPDFKPAQKAHAYDALARLNGSFARVIRNLSELENIGIFEIHMMRKLCYLSEEMRANTNYHLLETLQDCEERDWAEYGRRRERRERREL